MTDQQPMSPEPCEHHWIHYGQPSHSPIRWISQCSQCNQFNIEHLQEEARTIRAEALRDASRAWMNQADKLDHAPGKYYPGFWMKGLADQMEGHDAK